MIARSGSRETSVYLKRLRPNSHEFGYEASSQPQALRPPVAEVVRLPCTSRRCVRTLTSSATRHLVSTARSATTRSGSRETSVYFETLRPNSHEFGYEAPSQPQALRPPVAEVVRLPCTSRRSARTLTSSATRPSSRRQVLSSQSRFTIPSLPRRHTF